MAREPVRQYNRIVLTIQQTPSPAPHNGNGPATPGVFLSLGTIINIGGGIASIVALQIYFGNSAPVWGTYFLLLFTVGIGNSLSYMLFEHHRDSSIANSAIVRGTVGYCYVAFIFLVLNWCLVFNRGDPIQVTDLPPRAAQTAIVGGALFMILASIIEIRRR